MEGLNNIIRFLLPVYDQPEGVADLITIPVVFFITIWGLFAWTIIGVRIKANEKNWEKNWSLDNGSTLDAEHSSVVEVCEAVATNSEKTANIMPGTLLIIGLLGTFIGLGLALDSASTILKDSAAADSIESSLNELMNMLEGLGAKFKTSTWGLLAFVGMKFIFSLNGYEDKRLRWSIEKVNKELDVVRGNERQAELDDNNKLMECMQVIADKFHDVISCNQLENKDYLQKIAGFNQEVITVTQCGQKESLIRLAEHERSLVDALQLIASKQQKMLEEVVVSNKKHRDMMASNFASLEDILSISHKESSTLLEKNIQQSIETRDAMVGFVEKNEATVVMLGESAKGMSHAAENMSDAAEVMGGAATNLEGVINKFRINMEQVVELMKKDLSTTIIGMNTSFSENMKLMSGNLRTSIGDMSDSFKGNMSEMASRLGVATNDISEAVNSLSESVSVTMEDVTKVINSSVESQTETQEMQKKAFYNFQQSTNALIEKVNEMTGLVNKLSGDITSSLGSVADSNRRMKKVTDTMVELVGNIPQNNLALSQASEGIEKLASSLGDWMNNSASGIEAVFEIKSNLDSLLCSLSAQSDEIISTLKMSLDNKVA